MRVVLRLSALSLLLLPTAAGALSPWMVFFRRGSAQVSSPSAGTLDHLMVWYRNTDIRSFRVIGYADTDGPREANLRLSLRRAEAVKAAMVRRGVPPEIIHVEAKGESELIVETPDGVAHRENRRAAIVAERMCRPPAGPPDADC